MYKVKIKQFNGPYELLLNLIESRDLDITKIALSEVTEQFLLYIQNADDMDLDELSNFLIVASKLLFLKSRYLLPEVIEDNEDEECDDLEEHLKIYKQILSLMEKIKYKLDSKKFCIQKNCVKAEIFPEVILPRNCSIKILHNLFKDFIKRLEQQEQEQKFVLKSDFSLKQEVENLKKIFYNNKEIVLSKLLNECTNKVDIITRFLALLQVINKQRIKLIEKNNLNQILIIKE